MKALQFRRNLPRYAAARLAGGFRSRPRLGPRPPPALGNLRLGPGHRGR